MYMEQRIRFDKLIYSPSIVHRAIEDFQQSHDVHIVGESASHIEVRFCSEVSIETVIGEFCNYLIQLANRTDIMP